MKIITKKHTLIIEFNLSLTKNQKDTLSNHKKSKEFHERRSVGTCVGCGSTNLGRHPNGDLFLRCSNCLLEESIRKRKYRTKKAQYSNSIYSERKRKGKCVGCGEKVEIFKPNGVPYSRCEDCISKQRQNSKTYKQNLINKK